MTLPVTVRPAAETDIRTACRELEAARSGLAARFLDAIEEVIDRIGANPEIYAVIWHDVRAARLRKLRYLLYYVAFGDHIEVLAVMHGARNASAWQART